MKNYFSQIESTLPFFRQGELSNLNSNLFRKTSSRMEVFSENIAARLVFIRSRRSQPDSQMVVAAIRSAI
ncbi:hypothetical protein C5Y93_17550 [Blastopirellula marina]|uniref:Uncharacterized protein n=1 Tax=Blastopirellula marina TaxID=124 RepID=A0A2S8GKD1_9BACT|nr:hypothetical protein C5Y93_17550 [Blastopirellula marina]